MSFDQYTFSHYPMENNERIHAEIEQLFADSLKRNGELATKSYLFTLKNGIEKELENYSKQIIKHGKWILDEFKHSIIVSELSEKKGKDKKLIEGLLYQIRTVLTSPSLIQYDKDLGTQSNFMIEQWVGELSEKTERNLNSQLQQIEKYSQSIYEFYELSNYLAVLNTFIANKLSKFYHGFNYNIKHLDLEPIDFNSKLVASRIGGNDTPEDLVHDLKNILTSISGKKKFFNKNDKPKPTTIANHALTLDWFSDKWDYSHKQIYNILKEMI
ncbi:MAG: hypothetical protein JXR20_02805 [Balneola sp.]